MKTLTPNRKYNVPIDFDAYQEWRRQNPSSISPPSPALPDSTNRDGSSTSAPPTTSANSGQGPSSGIQSSRPEGPFVSSDSEPSAPYPTSFSQIIELITSGQPIPGIKDVPDTTLEGQASQNTTPNRRKPWEKDDSESGQYSAARIDVS